MIAVLRYIFLKTCRDSSLIAFLIIPALFPVAGLTGSTMGKGRLHYPFYMNAHYRPIQNAELVAQVTVMICILFSVLPAFWNLRSEVATKSIGSFLFAARPLTITMTAIFFSGAIAVIAWFGGLAFIKILTTALPPHPLLMTAKVVVGCFTGAAIGTLVVMISSDAGMLVGAYAACLILVGFFVESKNSNLFLQLIAAVAILAVSAAFSAFLLERRCAT